jgi:hypothetical protein
MKTPRKPYRVVNQQYWGFPDYWTLMRSDEVRMNILIRGEALAKSIALAMNRAPKQESRDADHD